ncbi:MAG: YceI family protein [Saprospiraceae bacterium]
MKLIVGLLAASTLVFSCKSDKKTDLNATIDPTNPTKPIVLEAEPELSTTGAAAYSVTEGVVYWQGRKKIGGLHNGTIRIAGGELLVKEGRLVDGTITLDMASISVSDLKDPGEKADLESHLKEADFFDTAKFPTAEFDVQEVLPSQMPDFNRVISGDLKMKGKAAQVNIPVKLTIDGNTLTAQSATFIINRTQWGVNYRSTVLGTAKDKLIDDNVVLSLTLAAKAK